MAPDEDGDEGPEEVEEINEDNIKKLAQQAAGGGSSDEDEEDEEPDVSDSGSGGSGSADASVEIEKVKATIDMLKEQNSSTSERIQTISGNVGEIRQMVHDQEVKVSDMEADVDKLVDQVEDIAPREIERRLNDIKSEIEENEADIKKLKEKVDNALQTSQDAQETLKNMGSLDNLLELNKEFEEKLSEIKEAERYIERLASKSERINIKIKKKMDEYSAYKAQVDSLQEKVSDMFKKLDEVSVDVEDAVKEDEATQLRERIMELEEQISEFEDVVPIMEMSLPEPIQYLREERKTIEDFLEELEEKHERGDISTSEYYKMKEANEEKLKDIKKKLLDEWEKIKGAAQEQEGQEEGEEPSAGPDKEPQGGSEGSEGSEEGEEQEEGDFDELLDGTIQEVKDAVESKNMDIEAVLEAEKEGKSRDTLIDWLESKVG